MSLPKILSWCVLAIPLPVFAQDASPSNLSHARFAGGGDALEGKLEFPKTGGDAEVIVSCTGHATPKGRLRNIRCSSADDPGLKFSNSVSRRARSARLEPAVVNGEPREVDFQFSVRFQKRGNDETVEVRLNNGNNVDRLGEHYVAAQRYSKHAWPSVCNDLSFLRQGGQKVIVEAAIVDRDGRSRDANVISEIWHLPTPCRTALTEQIASGSWIPGSLDGEYVETIWVSPIVINRTDDMRAGTVAEF